MDDRLYEFLLKLPRRNLVNLMMEALDYMQQYNGRSKSFCICSAMGLKEGKKDGTFLLKSIKEVKKYTEDPPLW